MTTLAQATSRQRGRATVSPSWTRLAFAFHGVTGPGRRSGPRGSTALRPSEFDSRASREMSRLPPPATTSAVPLFPQSASREPQTASLHRTETPIRRFSAGSLPRAPCGRSHQRWNAHILHCQRDILNRKVEMTAQSRGLGITGSVVREVGPERKGAFFRTRGKAFRKDTGISASMEIWHVSAAHSGFPETSSSLRSVLTRHRQFRSICACCPRRLATISLSQMRGQESNAFLAE